MPNEISPTNIKILNTARATAPLDYQGRIPYATQSNINEILDTLFSQKPLADQLTNQLANRIGLDIFNRNYYEHPFHHHDMGTLENGALVAETTFGLVQAEQYDPTNPGTFENTPKPGDYWQVYHKINQRDAFAWSVNMAMLKQSFLSSTPENAFYDAMVESVMNSNEYNTELIFTHLLNMAINEQMYPVRKVSTDFNDLSLPYDESRRYAASQVVECLKAVTGRMKLMSTTFSPIGKPTFSKPSEMVFYTTPEVHAAMDVQALAVFFNLEPANLASRIVDISNFGVIDEESAGLSDVQLIGVHEKSLPHWDTVNVIEELPQWNLEKQYKMHRHGIFGISPNFNGVIISASGTESVYPGVTIDRVCTGITISSVTNIRTGEVVQIDSTTTPGTNILNAVRGDAFKVNYTVSGTQTLNGAPIVGDFPQTVSCTMTNYSSGTLLNDPRTYTDGYVHIYVGNDEDSVQMNVRIVTDIPEADGGGANYTIRVIVDQD